jgi:hypothetical protein
MRINDEGFALLVFDADRDGPAYGSAQLTLQPIGTDSPSDEIILEWEN